jgi:integrase
MATITRRKNSDGTVSYLAQVRIRPFKPTAKAFSKRSEAKAWAKALEGELGRQRDHGAISSDVTQLTVGQLIEQYLEDPETQALRYHDSLSVLLAWWANYCGGEKVLELNVLKLREARDKLRKGRAPATVNRYLSTLRSCWNWGRASGLVPQYQLWPTRLMLKEDNERQRYLNDDELSRLLAAAKAHSTTMYAAVVVSIACGLRQGELLNLKWSDIDFDKNRIRIMRTKTDQPRTVHLPPVAAAAMRALKREDVVSTEGIFLSSSTGEPLKKGTIRIRWLEIRDAAKLSDFKWHDLRHSCASILAQNGATLFEIGSVLGHSSPSTTKRYSHLVEGAPVTGHAALDEMLRK